MFYYVLEDTVGEKNPKFTVGGQEDGAGQVSQFPGQFLQLAALHKQTMVYVNC